MIVRRSTDGWSVIAQADHAQHAGKIAEAWNDGPFGGSISDSLRYATAHHDAGWVETDSRPVVDAAGAPANFTTVDEETHTHFYGRAVRAIAEGDPAAAYLVSLHASGLYSRRYGWTGLKPVDWTAIGGWGRHLVESERAHRAELLARMRPEAAEFEASWRDYMLLETFDCLSLLTCFGLDCHECAPVPSAPNQWTTLSVRRDGPWEVALDPYPFAAAELVVEVPVRRLGVERFSGDDELRDALAAAETISQRTVYRPA